MAPKSLLVLNLIKDTITFLHRRRSQPPSVTLPPGGVDLLIESEYLQGEAVWLLDSADKETDQSFSTNDFDDVAAGYVTEQVDGSYLLTKIPRLIVDQIRSLSSSSSCHNPKLLLPGKEEELPSMTQDGNPLFREFNYDEILEAVEKGPDSMNLWLSDKFLLPGKVVEYLRRPSVTLTEILPSKEKVDLNESILSEKNNILECSTSSSHNLSSGKMTPESFLFPDELDNVAARYVTETKLVKDSYLLTKFPRNILDQILSLSSSATCRDPIFFLPGTKGEVSLHMGLDGNTVFREFSYDEILEAVEKGPSVTLTEILPSKEKVDLNESILSEKNNIFECSTSSSHNLSSDDECTQFIDALKKEVLEMDHICEVSSNHETLSSLLHGEAKIVTFCYYDTKEDQFEFYFKDSQDMASVVGVGLRYAKAILDKGCRIKVEEISKLKWEQTLSLVQSNATCVFKSLKLELPRSGVIGGDTHLSGRPLLWDLAKYFILKEIVTSFAPLSDVASSSNQPSSSEKSTSGNASNLLAICNFFRKLISEDANDPQSEGEPPSPNHRRALDGNCSAVVAIHLLEGGKIVNANLKPEMKQKLKVLDESILPNLEFKFSNRDGLKTIRSTIGKIRFNLDEEDKWRHSQMYVSFSLLGENRDYGEVERNSFEQLDLDPRSSTESTRVTRKLENKVGNGNATAWKASANPLGFGGSLDYNSTNSTDDTDSSQFEAGSEKKSDCTTGGLYTKMFEYNHKIACRYYSLDTQDYYELQPIAPSRRSQIVEFQGLWNIIKNRRDLPARSLVEYELLVSRCLSELTPEESDGESKSNEFIQEYEKKILLNHGMTQLDGRRHNLRELFQASGSTFLAKKGSWDEYEWRDSRGDEINSLAGIRGASAGARGRTML